MNSVLNTVVWVLPTAAVCLLRKRIRKKGFLVLLWLCMAVLLFEGIKQINRSLRFSSPEDAIGYLSSAPVVGIAEGEHSCFVITKTGNTSYQNNFLFKTEDGYKLDGYDAALPGVVMTGIRQETILASNGIPVTLYSVGGTTDHYVSGFFFETVGREIQITDTQGTVFQRITNQAGDTDNVVLVYAFVGPVDGSYQVLASA